MNGAIQTFPDQRRDEGILGGLGAALPQGDLVKLRAFLAGEGRLDVSDDDARRIVDTLKSAADRHWSIDPHRSVELADAIIAVGENRGDTWTRALGTMARGDAIKFIGSQQEAWDLLEESARLFQSIGDEVGWARTWIGRLSVAAQLNRLPEAIEQAGLAREIFARKGETLRQLRVDYALGEANWLIENQAAAKAHYNRALDLALKLGKQADREARAIYHNLGVMASSRGDPNGALEYFERAVGLARAHGEETAEAICRLNIAKAHMQMGRYRQALALLNEIQPRYRALFGGDTQLQYVIADCLLELRRFGEAAALFRETRHAWVAANAKLNAARSALQQAIAEAHLGNFGAANALLDEAEMGFSFLGETGLTSITHLRRGQLLLRRGDAAGALARALECARPFGAAGQVSYHAEAKLLEGEAQLQLEQLVEAAHAFEQTLDGARACASPALRYSAHLGLGRFAERQDRTSRALREYAAAEATLDRMQRNLTMMLRPAFLANSLDAQRARAKLLIKIGDIASAFDTVERVRAQITRGYLAGRESLRGMSDDPISAGLIAELNQLRGAHHALTSRAQGAADRTLLPDELEATRQDLALIERRMRGLSDQLRLRRPLEAPEAEAVSKTTELQQGMGEDEAMLAYFDDGQQLHGFYIDRKHVAHAVLSGDSAEITRAQDQLDRNLARALAAGGHESAAGLLRPAQSILARLGDRLLGPLAAQWRGKTRLYIVPYGQLHTLPFNLLRHDGRHLIESAEVVTLPSASLLLRRTPVRPAGARVLIHNDGGRLPEVARESEAIKALFPTRVAEGAEATRAVLRAPARKILHIAAHGAHRTDAPDFSHIALADGQLFIDDLLQMELGYELVTLSACETGRGRVTAGDEALGIGWAFLYAGAGAVISSLWRVSDARTAVLMERLYRGLRDGQSKAGALRGAQLAALAEAPDAHPAFWGAFQLYGASGALSNVKC